MRIASLTFRTIQLGLAFSIALCWAGLAQGQTTCFGIPSTATATVCSGRGTCVAADTCVCNDTNRYSGTECEVPVCDGILGTSGSVCSAQGICVDYDACVCTDPASFIGQFCQEAACNGVAATDGSVCSGNGSCNALTHICSCTDPASYTGSDCQVPICNSIPATDPSVCTTFGTCVSPDVCSCVVGYTGLDCQVPVCDGILSTDPSVCSGRGTCNSADNCMCDEPASYSGSFCQVYSCNGILSTEPSVCSGRGTCDSADNCVCDQSSLYGGMNCELAKCNGILSTNSSVCSANGVCVAPNTCTCDEGYLGTDCQVGTCSGIAATDESVCSGHGTCNPETHVCTCNEPASYTGVDCEVPKCNGIAATDGSVCSGHGTCVDANTCTCEADYSDPDCTLTVMLSASPLFLGAGEQTQLTWSSPAASSCTATVDWSGSKPVSGSTGVLVTVTSFFQLDCVDATASPGSDSVTVTVSGIANDGCLGAREIPSAGPFPFDDAVDTLDATAHASDATPSPECGAGPEGSTVWYRYTAPVSGVFVISTIGSDYDTVVSAWDDAEGCGSLVTSVACNDDGDTPPQSDLVFTADAGSTYLLQIGARTGGVGGQLSVSAVPEPSSEWLILAALASLLILRRGVGA